MNKSKRLRDSIETELQNAAAIPFRYKKVRATVKPPFGVYLLDLVRVDGCVEQYELTLDISDYDANEDHLEEIADQICAHMDYLDVLDDGQTWESYLNKRFPIEEPDKNLQRIRMTFEIRYIAREE